MAISEPDIKLLWGRAAGICSNPDCQDDLTVILENASNYNVGEMAHIIAKSEQGPRGEAGGGVDTYDNLILLCPTCHTHIDKSPEDTFSKELLHDWKLTHEKSIRQQSRNLIFKDLEDLKMYITRILIENELIFNEYGPQSKVALEDPGSNSFIVWNLRKLDTIIPNNQKIINVIEANIDLLGSYEYEIFALFKIHATSFEANQYHRVDSYATFPQVFAEVFRL